MVQTTFDQSALIRAALMGALFSMRKLNLDQVIFKQVEKINVQLLYTQKECMLQDKLDGLRKYVKVGLSGMNLY